MQEVKVIDRFLTQKEMESVWDYINSMSWSLQRSVSNIDFLGSDVSDVKYFNSYLFERVKDALDTDVKLQRVYFNGQWHGRDADLHTDGCDITALIYLSEYLPQWGGFTQVFLDDGREVVVSPQQGRMMFFPGNFLHKGYSFAYQTCPLRISLSYKMYLC